VKRVLFWGFVVPAVLRRLVPGWLLESPIVVAARHPWLALGAVLMAVGIGGLMVAASGVIPMKASAGHWAITEALLQFSKRQSISMHALGIAVPPLEDRSLVLRGAAHYDLGCRPCHGTPRDGRPRVALAMLPQPPELPPRIAVWSPSELFYIVKHGLKFTGMPAWPSQQRDDEVWAMVAFLQRLPQLEEAEYLALARAEPVTTLALDPASEPVPEIIVESCARCHGLDGGGRGEGSFPKLAGQRAEYLSRALRAYAAGDRQSGIMSSVVSGLTPDTVSAAVRFYAGRPPARAARGPADGGTGDADRSRGRAIALDGVPARDIPACVECHGPSSVRKNPAYPSLAGQYAEYLALQLRLLKERRRGGSEYVHLMHSFVDRLTAEDIRDTAAFFASLDPAASLF
jgi:cytochrome c553